MSKTSVEVVSGEELLRRLAGLEAIGLMTVDRWIVNEARQEFAIAEAQRLLERHGYYLVGWEMVEGAFYQFTYSPRWSVYPDAEHWPYWVELRYITSSLASGPQLALSYYDDGVLTAYEGSYRRTYGTNTSDAEKMRFHFEADYPDVLWKWLPVFDDHLPVVKLS